MYKKVLYGSCKPFFLQMAGNYSLSCPFQVTEADIEEFEANYRGSETKIKNLKDLYVKCK